MANTARGEIDIVANGKTYTLAMNTAGVMALQKHFRKPDVYDAEHKRWISGVASLDEIFRSMEHNSLEHVLAFVWAALQKHHPEITFAATADLIDSWGGLDGPWAQQLAALAATASADPKDVAELKEGANPPAAQAETRGTGENSNSQPIALV